MLSCISTWTGVCMHALHAVSAPYRTPPPMRAWRAAPCPPCPYSRTAAMPTSSIRCAAASPPPRASPTHAIGHCPSACPCHPAHPTPPHPAHPTSPHPTPSTPPHPTAPNPTHDLTCREVDVGKTLSETEWIGMCRREVMDAYLRDRAQKSGASVVNGLMMRMEQTQGPEGPWTIHYNSYEGGSKMGTPASVEVSASQGWLAGWLVAW